MGAIKETKQDNGTVQLEITYGGKEAPFGGVDSSAPPMYIAPNCFTNSSNFGVFNDQLIALGWVNTGIVLGSWINGMTFLDSGTAFINGFYYNWVLAYQQTVNSAGPPPVIDDVYTIWVWNGISHTTIPVTATCTVRQFAVLVPATSATAALVVSGSPATVAGTVSITVGGGATLPVTINIADSAATVASNIAIAINAAVGYPCTAAVDPKFTNQVNLTATTSGNAGNNLSILIGITQGGGGTVPTTAVWQGFSGGISPYDNPYGVAINPCSWVQVGESLYFSGTGTVILQFTFTYPFAVPIFQPISQYLGAITLAKFNNQLIAVGAVPGPGLTVQASEMIIAWSAPGKFQIWNPLYSDGTVTGAGFNQISDISDYLTGMIISPGAAIILRTQGIDYITPLSSGPSPFDFQHISNAHLGEGCQDSRLITQYDQVGFFVGNSDVYQFAGAVNAIGDRIKNLLVTQSQGLNFSYNKDAAAGVFNIDSSLNVIVMFLVGWNMYLYCPHNKTWMIFPFGVTSSQNVFDIDFWAVGSGFGLYSQEVVQFDPVVAVTATTGTAPTFWVLNNTVQNSDFPNSTSTFVTFPMEEIAFGRDITIDGLLVNCAGTPGQVITFTVGILTGVLTLPGTASPSVFTNYQVFFTTSFTDVVTVQNPQLTVTVTNGGTGALNQLSFAKITMFGSYDPNQRPV